jgi:uncharacterized protein involved in exopolysaccharide biosynthesis
MRDMVLQKLADFSGQLDTTRSSIAETKRRVAELEAQSHTTPSRLTTQVKKGENVQVMENLKATLMTLENKRTELLTKYQPNYPLVQEADKEIADTKAALAREELTPPTEETTDQNTIYNWIGSELAKAKADLSGLEARQSSLTNVVDQYKAQARQLEEQGIQQGDLMRTAKADEANYLLYTKKKEEARIDDELNRTRILNVSIAQAPTIPSLPTRSPLIFAVVACLLGVAVSMGVVFTLDYADQSFRTPSEVLRELRIPVLAAVPLQGSMILYGNGNGNGNGSNGLGSDLGYVLAEEEGDSSLQDGK